jgi:AICAR transformylase/IMP cyclohydrolase PurH
VTDPSDYAVILKEMRELNGKISEKTSLLLARKAFCSTSSYDANICEYLTEITKS